MSTIKLKRSATTGKIPTTSQLDLGELAINTTDGGIFIKKEYVDPLTSETVQEIVKITGSVPIENTLYIQKAGKDRNSGDTWSSAFATFEKALEVAAARQTLTLIDVGPGVYYTEGHLDLPDNTVIKATHRTAFMKPRPGFEERNVFRVGSGCFIEGLVFEGWRLDDMDDPSEGFAVAFRPGALITRVPYVHKVVVRTPPFWTSVAPPLDRATANPLVGRGAGVVLADASVLDPDSIFPNIMTWGATPVTHNGIGYCAKNGGLINAVNAVSLWCHRHFYALGGGQIILSSCATQFGDYTMVASGSRQLINPTEASVELTAQVTASNAIDLNKTNIINNMWSQLVSEGYTTGWPADYETITKRDAGLFLQSLSWTLRSGTEKPMLDFARGFYSTTGTRTFEPATYDIDKAQRDTLTINEAVSYDLLFNSNVRSIKAARSFYRASAGNLLTNFKTETLLALNKQKTTFGGFLVGTAQTRANALFDEIIDIVDNGESAAAAYSLTDPTSYDTGYFNARRLLYANSTGANEFIQDEIIAWINSQVAANTAPFQNFVYDEALCRRDTGMVIDAIAYDMAFGSNFRSIIAGRSYLRAQAANVTASQLRATVGALTQLKTLLLATVTGNATATASVTSNMDYIILIIENGLASVPAYVLPQPTNIATGYQNAVTLIEDNRDFIKAEVIQHIKVNFTSLVYDTDICRRDIDYILDSTIYDLTYGGNLETLVTAKSYYDNVLSSFIIDSNEIAGSVSAYTFLATLIAQVATSSVTSTLQTVEPFVPAEVGDEGSSAAGISATNLINIIVNYLSTQTLASATAPSLSWVDSGLATQFTNISTQKAITIDSVITYIDNNYVVFSYNQSACRRDVTYILEALAYDLTYGGNLETYNAAMSYFVGSTSQYGTGEKLQTVAALNRLKNILASILQGTAITKSSGNTKTQVTNGTAGSLSAALFSQARIDDIVNTITNDGVAPAKILPVTTWPASDFQTGFNTTVTNTRTIARDVSVYTTVESNTLIGAFIFCWENMKTQINTLPAVGLEATTIVNNLVYSLITTIIDPRKFAEPSTITAVGHTWTGIMTGVALTKIPPSRNFATIEESILELNNGLVIASGQDDQGSALFIGGMKIDADTGELTGPPFEQSVNRIATRAAIARSF